MTVYTNSSKIIALQVRKLILPDNFCFPIRERQMQRLASEYDIILKLPDTSNYKVDDDKDPFPNPDSSQQEFFIAGSTDLVFIFISEGDRRREQHDLEDGNTSPAKPPMALPTRTGPSTSRCGMSVSQMSVELASLFPITTFITVAFLQADVRNLTGTGGNFVRLKLRPRQERANQPYTACLHSGYKRFKDCQAMDLEQI